MIGTMGIGERLRNAREAKRLTLEDASAQTRIRPAYLQALEDEAFDQLPGPIYAKGFLRVYAAVLGLDPDDLVAVYPEAFAAPRSSLMEHPAEVPIRPVAAPSRARRFSAYALAVLFIAASIVGYVGYQGWRAFNAPVEVAAPPAIRPAPAPSPAPTPAPAPAAAPAPLPQVTAPGTVAVTIRAQGSTWIRVTVDGRRTFEGFLILGDIRTWSGREVTVRLGNAPVSLVDVNGRRVAIPPGIRVWQQTFAVGRP